MKRTGVWAVRACALGAVALVLGAGGCKKKPAGPPEGMEFMEAVQVVQARTATWLPRAQLVGTAFPIQSITLTNEVAGVITSVGFESGSIVEQGQVLLTLDAATEEADLAAAEASVRVAEAGVRVVQSNIDLWQLNVQRLTEAVASNAASKTELDTAKATLASAQAQLEQTQATILQAKAHTAQVKSQMAKKTVRAPFKAKAGIRNLHPGQYLAEGTSIVGLQAVSENIYLDFALPQDQVWRVKEGDVVTVNSQALGDGPSQIKVVAIDATADRSTRNVRVRGIVDNKAQRLRPGMFVDVEVPVGQAQEHVVVPSAAVRRASYGDHVFMIEADKDKPGRFVAKQRFVKLGASLGNDVIVNEGLRVGEKLAGAGSFKLRDNAPVMVGPPPGAPGAPGGTGGPPSGGEGPKEEAKKAASAD